MSEDRVGFYDATPVPIEVYRHAFGAAMAEHQDAILRGDYKPAQRAGHAHHCDAGERLMAFDAAYGPAIAAIWVGTDGTAWAGNDEYGTRIVFCPFCGERVGREEVGDDDWN